MQNVLTKLPILSKQLIKEAQPKLKIFWKCARVELAPPKPSELPLVKRAVSDWLRSAKTGKWKNVTVREAWLNTLIVTEVICWFFVGECIGKGRIIGYKV